jgi:hypothetical protein
LEIFSDTGRDKICTDEHANSGDHRLRCNGTKRSKLQKNLN